MIEPEDRDNRWPQPPPTYKEQLGTGVAAWFGACLTAAMIGGGSGSFEVAAAVMGLTLLPPALWLRFKRGWLRFEAGVALGVAITLGLGVLAFGLCFIVVVNSGL